MGSNWTLTLLTLMTTVFLSLGFSILSNDYLFGLMKYFPVFKSITHYDGPAEISNAPTDPTTTMLPTLEQMMYYNYYTSSMYCPYDLKNLSCEYCVKFKKDVNKLTVLRNDTHNTLALVTLSEKRKEIVVTYRGSTNFWNFFLDFYAIDMIDVETRTSALRGIKIHRGFYIATMSLYKDVVAAVGYLRSIKRRYAKYKLVICGHSLGGAMARVTQYFLHSLNQFSGVKLEVYTYGEFRSGNKAYVDYMNKLSDVTARIVSRADIIAHLPPTKALRSGDPYLHKSHTCLPKESFIKFFQQR
ncbi:Lipase, partial [Pseudolycoriella hygida]